MTVQNQINTLMERAKELDCLYKTSEILKDCNSELSKVLKQLLKAIATGWRFPDLCKVSIAAGGVFVQDEGYLESTWKQTAMCTIDNYASCKLTVAYPGNEDEATPFLNEEQRLLDSIAERLCVALQQRALASDKSDKALDKISRTDWKVIIKLIQKSDPDLYLRIARKMMNYLSGLGIEEARNLLANFGEQKNRKNLETIYDTNRPFRKENKNTIDKLIQKAFAIADEHLNANDIYARIQAWLQGDKISFLVQALENLSYSLNTIQDSLHRFHNLSLEGIELPQSTKDNIIALLLLRFFTEQLDFINISKAHVDINDFVELVRDIVFPTNSYGKLGGKSAGIFLSYNILCKIKSKDDKLGDIKVPKTRYLLSDALHQFLNFNELNELIEQKYKSIERIRDEYPNIIQVFKNSNFPPNIISGLALALDDFDENPIIVRSSSLLEDRIGAAFSGKYKSLFLANQGTKEERLYALLDAIAEVYASTFGPDPVEYRKERGLLDFHEEMAIIIQQVVGTKVGDYWLPAFAGVAFGNNEFRWSPRIQRENGLVRLVPGLGTRAVDRVSDDFPILVSPGQPNLRVNLSNDEILRYSPRMIDVINLKKNTFETIDFIQLYRQYGSSYPIIEQIVSIYSDGEIMTKSAFNMDIEHDMPVVTFEGLITKTNFMPRMKHILDQLKAAMGVPVDIEFAFDGKDLYLLQCRAQSSSPENRPASIPKDLAANDILFTANKYISNGIIQEISHIVIIDPEAYSGLGTMEEMKMVGRIVSKLNKILPKHKFILLGPGRWGSRGDIKLGVSVTYSDINNAAMLIEIARKKGNYTPDVSFGTHFFQDLVEAGIKYLPLYPDEPGIQYNQKFLSNAKNILNKLVPDAESFSGVVKVIDVEKSVRGKQLTVRMNGDLDEAIAHFTSTTTKEFDTNEMTDSGLTDESHWLWRFRMAEHIAQCADYPKYGIKAIYLFGSVKNGNAGPGSDIDLMIHTNGTAIQKRALTNWLDGWSQSLAELNYLKTGYKTTGLLDIHYINDKDITDKTSYACKINAVTDAARLLKNKA